VSIDELLRELEEHPRAMSLFYLDKVTDLKPHLAQLKITEDGHLTWAEFLELLFTHKRNVKSIPDTTILTTIKEKGKFRVQTKNHPIVEYHTIKEKLRGESMRVRRELEKTFSVERLNKGKEAEDVRPKSATKKITVPKPFKFAEREEVKEMNIRQKKLNEMIEHKMLEEENFLHHQFIANKIPKTTKEPRYEMLKFKNEERRDEVKRTSIEVTKARENPFSFYERDKDFYVKRAKASEQHIPDTMNHKPFKANPIPWSVSTPLFHEMQAKEEKTREERVKKRAQEMATLSKLPPRMEMHERIKQQGKLPVKSDEKKDQFTFKPKITRHNPDFKAQQDNFQKALEKHKKQKKATVVQPFTFNESKQRASIMNYMDNENTQKVGQRPKTGEISSLKKPSVNPPSTAKVDAMVKLRREQLEKRKERELAKLVDDNHYHHTSDKVSFLLNW